MNEFMPHAAMTGDLDSLSDEALHDLIVRSAKLLEMRKAERQKKALAEIKRIAKENGLDVVVSRPARKRGRPAKNVGPV